MHNLCTRMLLVGSVSLGLLSCPSTGKGGSSSGSTDPDLFYVYSDAASAQNHYAASGWMGDRLSIELDDAHTDNVFMGTTCQKWTYLAEDRVEGWCGVVWQDPENNWDGDIPDSGYDLDGALFLSFRVRGEVGGEVVSFGFGGLEGPFPDSAAEQKTTHSLSTEWTEVSIVVDHLDLSAIHNGFLWTIDSADNGPEALTFYLDEIRYEFSNTSDSTIHKLSAICFGPFTKGGDPTVGDTVTSEQVADHMELIAPYTDWIRTYGIEGGLADAGWIAHAYNLNIAMGAWIDDDAASNASQLEGLIDAALAGDVDIAVIGNEVLLRRDLEVAQLIDLIEAFKAEVPNVPVTTADAYSVWLAYPDLVDACDLLFIHCYPFWDGAPLEHAVGNLHSQYERVLGVAGGKDVVVSETGWPSDGVPVGDAVPSPDNAAFYFLNVSSWSRSLGIPVFYFEAFDEPFKAWQEPYEVGDHWGVFTSSLVLKDRMNLVFEGHITCDYWIRDLPCGDGEASIEFTYVPPIGSDDDLMGQACHAWPVDHGIAVYIYVQGGWWTKPFFDQPMTVIQSDGTFVTDITTGGTDENATRIAAFLVPADYSIPLAGGGGLPQSIQDDALASLIVDR